MSATEADTNVAETQKRGRGRPKLSDEEKAKRKSERESAGYYERSFKGRVRYILGIKTHAPSGIPYAHHCVVEGVGFQRMSQRAYHARESDGIWQRLSQPGVFGKVEPLTARQVQRMAERIRHFAFRPTYIGDIAYDTDGNVTNQASKFKLIDLSSTVGMWSAPGEEKPEPQMVYQPSALDIPAARCLIALRVTDAEEFGRLESRLPTIAQQQPSLGNLAEEYTVAPLEATAEGEDFGEWE